MLSPTSERLWGGLEVVWYVSIEPKITVGANCKQGVFLPQGPGVACAFCVDTQTPHQWHCHDTGPELQLCNLNPLGAFSTAQLTGSLSAVTLTIRTAGSFTRHSW